MKKLYVLLVFIIFMYNGCGYKAPPKYIDDTKKEMIENKKAGIE